MAGFFVVLAIGVTAAFALGYIAFINSLVIGTFGFTTIFGGNFT